MSRLDQELQRLLADDYLSDLADRPVEDLRTMRAECQRTETSVSFLRRLAQGRLDIIHAFLDRREDDGGTVDLAELVEELPAIIAAGPPRPAGFGRLPVQMAPLMDGDELTAELHEVLDAGQVMRLGEMSEEQLRAVAERLGAFESAVSQQRRALHERIDRLQREIVDRYKSGGASADALLT